ncbi:ABC transporter substrate-binding protein [Streptomyces sp. MCAF7]
MRGSLRGTRLAAVLASVLLLFTTATACGSEEESGADDGTSAASGGAFPVTIPHKYGSTTIENEPKRIVTVGLTDQDAVLALGKVPVGTTEWNGGYEGAIGPWARDELGSAKTPTVLKDTGTGPQTEKIAALRPDLILAVYGGLTKEQYETLSKFAPVVAQPKEYNDFGVPWQRQTELIGTGDEFGANISKERTDLLDTDAIVWIVADPAEDEGKLDRNPLYADLKVAKQDREVYVKESSDYGNAISFVTVLSLPYTLDRLAPQLAAAVDGKPATRVTQPAS